MLKTKWRQTVASIRDLVLAGDTSGIDDATLLALFVSASEEAAFEAIVRRHGPLVYGVCLRVLQNASDAEDAFQATFLVLVRKAAGLKRPELLGSWLYGVAFQTARSARTTARRHRKLESQLIPREHQSAPTSFKDLSVVLDEELERLPAKYRVPIVLCELQDKSRKDAAATLGLPEGTISSRLARGKALLAQRLTRRNITLGSAALGASLASTSIAPSAALVQLTVRAGTAALAGKSAAAGVASVKAMQLSETVIHMMFASKLKLSVLVLAGGALLISGAGLLMAKPRRGPAAMTSPASTVDDEKKTTAPAAAQTAHFREAIDAASEIEDLQKRLALIFQVAEAQINAGDRAGALATLAKVLPLVRGMEESAVKVRFLHSIAYLVDLAGDRAQGSQIAIELEKTSSALRDPQDLKTGLFLAISLWTFWDEFEKGLELIRRHPQQASDLIPAMIRAIQPGKGHEPGAHAALEQLVQIVSQWPNDGKWNPERDPPQVVNGFHRAIRTNDVIRLETLDSLAIGLARAGYAEDALRLHQANRAIGANAKGWGAPSLSELGEALARAGKFPEALQVAARIREDSIERLSTAHEIALEQVRAGDFAGALQTISVHSGIPKKAAGARNFDGKITTVTPRGKTIAKADVLRAIGLAQLEKGNRTAALATLDALRRFNDENGDGAEQETNDLRGFGFNEVSRLALFKRTPRVAQVELEVALDELPAARKTAGNLISALEKAQAFFFLGKSLLAAGKKSDAKQDLSRASRSAERIPMVDNGARGFGFGGHEQAGIEDEMRGYNGGKYLLLRQIAGLQARAGDVEGAFETAESFSSPAGLDALVVDLAVGGNFEAALDSLGKLTSTNEKAQALFGIGRAMCRQGEEKAAAALASKQKDPLLRVNVLLGMAMGSGPAAKPAEPVR